MNYKLSVLGQSLKVSLERSLQGEFYKNEMKFSSSLPAILRKTLGWPDEVQVEASSIFPAKAQEAFLSDAQFESSLYEGFDFQLNDGRKNRQWSYFDGFLVEKDSEKKISFSEFVVDPLSLFFLLPQIEKKKTPLALTGKNLIASELSCREVVVAGKKVEVKCLGGEVLSLKHKLAPLVTIQFSKI